MSTVDQNQLNVEPWEHTCTRVEWEDGQGTEPPVTEPEHVWRCGACGRDYTEARRMADHLVHAHGWSKPDVARELGMERYR